MNRDVPWAYSLRSLTALGTSLGEGKPRLSLLLFEAYSRPCLHSNMVFGPAGALTKFQVKNKCTHEDNQG